MLSKLIKQSGVPRETLVNQIKEVHQKHGTSEYAFLIQELPCLVKKGKRFDPSIEYAGAIKAYREERAKHLKLYPTVAETLAQIKAAGSMVVGYTESMAFYTKYRVKKLGLDGVLDYLYSPADHDLPVGLSPEQIRTYPPDCYLLRETEHRHTPAGELKPNPVLLSEIIQGVGAVADDCLYVGDSLVKDIAMAKDVNVMDVHAAYGIAHKKEEYELLREVTHWTEEMVQREKTIECKDVKPTFELKSCFGELLQAFEFIPFNGG